MRAAVGNVEPDSGPAGIKAMGSDAGRNKADYVEPPAVDLEHAIGHHIGSVECRAVGRYPHVLRHALSGESDITQDTAIAHIDFGDAAAKFTGKDCVPASRGIVAATNITAIRIRSVSPARRLLRPAAQM